jgi:hypothetical protein
LDRLLELLDNDLHVRDLHRDGLVVERAHEQLNVHDEKWLRWFLSKSKPHNGISGNSPDLRV